MSILGIFKIVIVDNLKYSKLFDFQATENLFDIYSIINSFSAITLGTLTAKANS